MTLEEWKTVLAVVAIVVSLASFMISFAWSRQSTIAGRRPILVFVYDGMRGWTIRNVGNGPALNVLVAQKRVGGEWFAPVRIPPLAISTEFGLEWLGHMNDTGLGATYTDFEQRTYSTKCGNDLSEVFSYRVLPEWREEQIKSHWNAPHYSGQRT
jgi:hypothetical protein